jgi:purine-binding chemotaxis protein CheW
METNTLTFPLLRELPQVAADSTDVSIAESPILDAPVELLCFRLDGQEYGLPLHLIQEIRRYQVPTALPGQDAAALGVLNLRGQVIALMDLRQLLGLSAFRPAVGEEDLRAVVVLVHKGRHLGLVVDDVVTVLHAQPEEFRGLPTMPGNTSQRHLRGLILAGARHVLLLHPSEWIAAYASPAA